MSGIDIYKLLGAPDETGGSNLFQFVTYITKERIVVFDIDHDKMKYCRRIFSDTMEGMVIYLDIEDIDYCKLFSKELYEAYVDEKG